MERLKNIAILLGNIYKKMPIMMIFVLLTPIFSGLLTVFVYTAQVNLIDIIANNFTNSRLVDLLNIIISPLALFLGVSLAQSLINTLSSIFTNKLSTLITWQFKSEIVDITNKIPYIEFNDKEFSDKLERAKSVVGEDLVGIIASIVSVFNIGSSLFSLILLLLTHKLYLIAILVFIMICVNLAIKLSTEIKVRKLGRQLTFDGRVADYINGLMNETSAIREMRLYNCTGFFLDIWRKNITYQNKVRYGARKIEIKMGIVVSVIQTTVILIVIIILIAQMQSSSTITIGLLSVLFLGLVQCKNRIMDLLWPLCRLYISSVKLYDFNEVLCRKEYCEETVDESSLVDQPVPIIMKNISFSYRDSSPLILSNLSLAINKGEKIAIVGANGAGKSTLIKLILGLYTPNSGEITWNGHQSVSKNISVVYQNYIKYELTLRENIALGNVNKLYNDDEIIEIIDKCGLHDLYEKLGGLDKPIGYVLEGGSDISGGQWQRLAIARALYRDSDLLVFDEPTATIDPQTEVKIYEMLMEICSEKTAIFVSHRLGWAKNSDRILVLNDKGIAEEGTHEQLIEKKGLYYDMFNLQSSWYTNDDS